MYQYKKIENPMASDRKPQYSHLLLGIGAGYRRLRSHTQCGPTGGGPAPASDVRVEECVYPTDAAVAVSCAAET